MATLASTPTKDYVSLRTTPRDPGMSPSYRSRHCTPPRLVSLSSELSSFESPMFTPSPLRQRPLFPNHLSDDLPDGDDLFLQSPYRLPALAHNPSYTVKPQPIPADDEEGSIFLASSPPARSPFLPSSSSQPLRTPVKQMHRVTSRSALAIKHLNTPPPSEPDFAAVDSAKPASRVGIGTKRKSVQSNTTPVRQNTLTPLIITSAQPLGQSVKQRGFDRLAPLPPPKFVTQTPQTRAETDVYLKRQTATLTRLRLTDFNDTAEELGIVDDDSGCELDHYERVLFTCPRPKNKDGSLGRTSDPITINKHKTKEDEEVVEAISPGGHIIKRRARSRPLSAELLESVQRSPTSPVRDNHKATRPRLSGIVFPSVSHRRGHSRSNSSSSESASPQPRRRLNNGPPPPPNFQTSRSAMSRQSSGSSATLFFGPTITPAHSPIASTPSSNADLQHVRLKSIHRHSHPGSDTAPNSLPAWNAIQNRASASPQSSPHQANTSHSSIDEDEDLFFNSSQDLSFKFSITEGTPSPKSRKSTTPLPIKYKPRDSGVVLSDEDMDILPGDYQNGMPAASTSVGTLPSDGEDDLVTPGVGPEEYSGWPTVVIEGNDHTSTRHLSGLPGNDADAFIMRMLTKTGNMSPDGKKRVPGTPVKAKKAFLGAQRPWQSAVAAKIALHDDWGMKKEGKVPRKSLPAALPAPGKRTRLNLLDQSTDSEKEEDSPSNRRERYVGLGLGRPDSTGVGGSVFVPRTRWLMRRSSSGAFSSGSESPSSAGTPTQPKGRDWHLPSVSVQFSPSRGAFKLSPLRSTSNSSNSSIATLNSPTLHYSRQSNSMAHTHIGFDSSSASRRLSALSSDERFGRFERDFVELDELGSGEFGKVIKVRRKVGNDGDVFAVKKSKRFEGPRHRLRLREEADILRHLAKVAVASAVIEGDRHPNVLGYIDSWEEDDVLFIQTELCESGSLSRFLWEYGRVFPRLDEARVWKIVADLSNGLRFIHDAGVIHLDLKPSNVLITREGRFKIGDFGMASMWPRPNPTGTENGRGGFEREGDKLYLAPEVLQGEYSKAADVFSFGMTILETATNIVVPDQGDAWHRLRREDFSQIDLDSSPELLDMIKNMMRTAPSSRMPVHAIFDHPIVSRARAFMEHVYITAKNTGTSTFAASPLASTHHGFLSDILGRAAVDDMAMDLSA